jgi:hypothetical protein
VALAGAALLGHLHWWRAGSPAPDLKVAGAEAAGVDWSGFPASPPAGYETAPGKRRPGRSGTEKRKRNAITISLTDEELAQLEVLAKACGGSLSGAVKGLLAEAAERAHLDAAGRGSATRATGAASAR